MSTKAGVGFSENPPVWDAGAEAAIAAMASAGVMHCDLAILSPPRNMTPLSFETGWRSVIGPSERDLSAAIPQESSPEDQLGYEGHQVGVAVIASELAPRSKCSSNEVCPTMSTVSGSRWLGRSTLDNTGESRYLPSVQLGQTVRCGRTRAQYGHAPHPGHVGGPRHVAPRGRCWHDDGEHAVQPHFPVVR